MTEYLRTQFAAYDFADYSALVLGCTHFNYFKDTMREILPDHIRFVDGNEGTVNELIRRLRERNELEELPQTIDYFYSGRPVHEAGELERIRQFMRRLDQVYAI